MAGITREHRELYVYSAHEQNSLGKIAQGERTWYWYVHFVRFSHYRVTKSITRKNLSENCWKNCGNKVP